jgi:hypothetical protein
MNGLARSPKYPSIEACKQCTAGDVSQDFVAGIHPQNFENWGERQWRVKYGLDPRFVMDRLKAHAVPSR